MEDAHATILDLNKELDTGSEDRVSFFGVYDGHGGRKTAIFTGQYLHEIVTKTAAYHEKDYTRALKDGFLLCDQAVLQDFETRNDESGCAATAAIITPNKIYCANAGDSRTVVSIDGFAKAVSYDHKPYNEGEKARITAGGGYVDAGRVNGNLALSRGIGDFIFKMSLDLPAEEQIVTCYPDVITHDINYEKDEFVILACDGIWDCLSSQSCVECVRRGIYERKLFTEICEEIMELCCAPTSDGSGIGCDNMSILIVALLDYEKNETLDQWYDKIIKKVDLHNKQMENIKGREGDANAYIEVTKGPISPVYNDLYKELFGEFYDIGQQGNSEGRPNTSAGYASVFANMGLRHQNGSAMGSDEDDEFSAGHMEGRDDEGGEDYNSGAISLQRLLSSNVITNENGVIYLDTSSAQSLLASFGMSGADESEKTLDDQGVDEQSGVHQKHIEEVDEDDETREDDKTKEDDETKEDDTEGESSS